MTVSCREQVMAAVLAKLQGIAIAGLTVEEDRPIPVRAGDLPKLVLRSGDESAEQVFCSIDSYVLGIEVEGYATADTPAAVNALLGQMRAECDRVLLSDFTLGGLVHDLAVADEPKDPTLGFDGAPNGKAFVRTYQIRYATMEADPYVFA